MHTQPSLDLPESVQRQLAVFRRRLRWIETLIAVLGTLVALLAVYVILFVSDRLWDTPMLVRILLAAAALGGLLAGGWFWFSRWGWRERSARELATLAQRQFPRLGDRLLGIVELAEDRGLPETMSPTLRQAAMAQVAREAEALDFRQAVSTRRPRRFTLAVAALLAIAGLAFVIAPGAGWNALQRLLKPVAAISRYTLVKLTGLPAERVVAFGEPFALEAVLAPDSRWQPGTARGRLADLPPVEVPREHDVFRFEMPGATEAGAFTVQAGDARAAVAIRPLHRPELARLDLFVEYPDYLGYPVATQQVTAGKVELIAGSRVALTGRATRDLARATLDGEPLTVTGTGLASAARALETNAVWRLAWEDAAGLAGKEPLALQLIAREDAAPRVRCRDLDHLVAILEDEVLSFAVAAEDDFGVRSIGLEWEAAGNADRGVAPSSGRAEIASGDPQARQLDGSFRFAPAAMGLGPQKILLYATATDYRPGREPVRSSPYVVYVLDRIEHAKLIQQRLERLQERLEEIARIEETLFERNQQLAEALNDPQAVEKLREQQRAEEANTEALRRLQEEGLELLKEAMRNQTIDESVLREWAETLKKLQELAQQDMPAVAGKLGETRQSETEQQREAQMNQALTKQQEVLQKLQASLQQLGEAGEQLLAGNFVNRLRQAAALEKEIADEITRIIPETIGLPANKIPISSKTKLSRVEERQRRAQRGVRHIRDDLAGFFNRTRRPVYGEVHEDMTAKRVVDDLQRLADQIAANVGAQSVTDTLQWNQQLTAWADKLEGPKNDGGGGGGGGGGGEMSAEMMELVMRLMRLRQAEEGLRDQTRFLEEHKTGNPLYPASAERMASLQASLRGVVERTQREYPIPELRGLLDDVGSAMKDSERLLSEPDTGAATVAAQTEVIELLSLACDQSAGGGGSSASLGSSWMMALMRMLGMGSGAGASGGGSTAGGTTDQPNQPPLGPAGGTVDPSRTVEQAVGRDRGAFPAEFRDVLDAYFRARDERAP